MKNALQPSANIDCLSREITHLVASVRLFACTLMAEVFGLNTFKFGTKESHYQSEIS